ncbi:hypothetical protein SESBI_02452 [Sesbania bispinosa]|nr:hypothetical protein SESBI_02452 [Sesbania bispinosa]
MNAPVFPGQKVLGDAFGMETLPIEQIPVSSQNEDVEVNITGCTNSGKALVVQDSCDDETESSSSFGDTGSGTENVSSFSDTEVESRMCSDNASSSMCDDWRESLRGRKKRMTNHWRKFISPLMWRCKWIELRLKQLQSQALKYDRELAAYNYTKQHDFAHLTLDGSAIKSIPISGRMHRNKVMKRKKRKRVEEKCDLASYMSNHSLFSYYEKTDCSVDAHLKDCPAAIGGNNDTNEEFELNDLWSSVDYEDNDKSLDDFIQKIEAIQSQVQKLKTRYDKPASFAGNENTFPVSFGHTSSQLQSEFQMGDLLMPGNTSSSEGIIPLIEATDRHELDDPWEDVDLPITIVTLPWSMGMAKTWHIIEPSNHKTKDEVLIQNPSTQEELHDFENVGNQLVKKTEVSAEANKSYSQVQDSEPDSTENAVHSTLKSCTALKPNVPRNKRKGRKKSGSKRWTRRLSG